MWIIFSHLKTVMWSSVHLRGKVLQYSLEHCPGGVHKTEDWINGFLNRNLLFSDPDEVLELIAVITNIV